MPNRFFAVALTILCGGGLLCGWRTDGLAWYIFEALVFMLVALWSIGWAAGKWTPVWSWMLLPLLCVAAWGGLQASFGWSVYPFLTGVDVLRWLTYAAILFLGYQSFGNGERRQTFRHAFTVYSLLLAIVSVFQYFLGNGKIFWLFDTTEPAGLGPFLNRDHYASFIALALPVAVVEISRKPRDSWFYALTAAVLYASAIAGASRAGFILLTFELVILAVLLALSARALLGLGALIVALGFVVGWETLYERMQAPDPYAGRREVALSSIDMVKASPWKGSGLGTWTTVYPAYAKKDFGVFINAAHNDWLQWACDGGVPMTALLLAVFLAGCATVPRAPWALGVPIVFLHGLIDFPMQGRFLPCLVFLLLGIAGRTRQGRRSPAGM